VYLWLDLDELDAEVHSALAGNRIEYNEWLMQTRWKES